MIQSVETFRVALFADSTVGERTVKHMLRHCPGHVAIIVVTDASSEIADYARSEGFDKTRILTSEEVYSASVLDLLRALELQFIVLAWWPHIIKEPLLSMPARGIINFHPSLLPHGRGKDPNFWSLAEDTPYGVSLMLIDASVDGGDILFQRQIPKTWEDTGKTLYAKGLDAMTQLFVECYPKIVAGEYEPKKQVPEEGSFHYRQELEPASQIDLDRQYKARDLLNLIRARTFPPHPACYFYEGGNRYEVRIEIKAVQMKSNGPKQMV